MALAQCAFCVHLGMLAKYHTKKRFKVMPVQIRSMR